MTRVTDHPVGIRADGSEAERSCDGPTGMSTRSVRISTSSTSPRLHLLPRDATSRRV